MVARLLWEGSPSHSSITLPLMWRRRDRMNPCTLSPFTLPGQSERNRRVFSPLWSVAMAPVAEIRFQLNRCICLGVLPLGAQVRRTVGVVENPLSSTKTSVARFLRAFFLPWARCWRASRRSLLHCAPRPPWRASDSSTPWTSLSSTRGPGGSRPRSSSL